MKKNPAKIVEKRQVTFMGVIFLDARGSAVRLKGALNLWRGKMKNKPQKLNKNSVLIVREKVGEVEILDIFTGEKKIKDNTKEYIAEGEVSLGSVNKPNRKIVHIKYDMPPNRRN